MREMLPILALCLAVLQPCGSQAMAPPRQPPASLLEAFTLNGTVPLEFYYVDDSNQGRGRLTCNPSQAAASPVHRHALQVLAVGDSAANSAS